MCYISLSRIVAMSIFLKKFLLTIIYGKKDI